jgi:hypothetical protein
LPVTRREAPEPAPYCSIAAMAACLMAGCWVDPDAVLAHGLGQRPAQMAALQIVEFFLRELIE